MPTDAEEKASAAEEEASAAASRHARAVYLALAAWRAKAKLEPTPENREKVKVWEKEEAKLPILTKEIYGGKTRGGGGLRLFTRRKSPPPRPHTSYVGYANKSPLEGPHRPIPTEWMKKHRASMSNPKKGGRRTRRRGVRASRKRPTR
jgi:hypothetical protein